MEIKFYLPEFMGAPNKWLAERGWIYSPQVKYGMRVYKYRKPLRNILSGRVRGVRSGVFVKKIGS